MSNPFDRFTTQERTIKVEALDNEEVTIRHLTVAERKRVDEVLGKDSTRNDKGRIVFDTTSFVNSQLLAVSLGLVQPKMKIPELEKLSSQAVDAIGEIHEAVLNPKDSESKVKKK